MAVVLNKSDGDVEFDMLPQFYDARKKNHKLDLMINEYISIKR